MTFASCNAENRHLRLELLKALRIAIRDRDTHGLRLAWRALNAARRCPGIFRFRFGTVRYLDAQILYFQYVEIMQDKCYDFHDANQRPMILDCGGNIGMSVIRFKMLYPNARITVFEADSGVAEVLAENIESLGLSDVSVIPVSVGTVDGTVPFLHDGLDGGRICNVAESRIAVPSVRLADQIRERIDLLKLDIEGAEFSVISDLVASTAIQRVRRIVCEVHCTPHCCNKLAALFGDLADAGFSVCIGHAGRWKLPAPPDRLPFVRLGSGYFLVHLYAWRPPVANTQCS